MPVLIEDTAQSGTSLDAVTGDLGLIDRRRWQRAQRSSVGDTLMGPVAVVELFELAQGA